MPWRYLIHIGDLPLTVSAAAAVTVWMLIARAWRMAFWWSLLFLLAIGIVAATKIAFLIWGSLPPAYGFRALSGHAAGVTAVAAFALFLSSQGYGARLSLAGVTSGLLLGGLMCVLLVACDEHSIAEAAGGWAVGALAALGAIGLGGAPPPASASLGAIAGASMFFVASVVVLRPLPIGYLMWRAAKLVARHAGALVSAGF